MVIGMEFIGCEVAASLRQKGVEVECIDPSPTLVSRSRLNLSWPSSLTAGWRPAMESSCRAILGSASSDSNGTGLPDAVCWTSAVTGRPWTGWCVG